MKRKETHLCGPSLFWFSADASATKCAHTNIDLTMFINSNGILKFRQRPHTHRHSTCKQHHFESVQGNQTNPESNWKKNEMKFRWQSEKLDKYTGRSRHYSSIFTIFRSVFALNIRGPSSRASVCGEKMMHTSSHRRRVTSSLFLISSLNLLLVIYSVDCSLCDFAEIWFGRSVVRSVGRYSPMFFDFEVRCDQCAPCTCRGTSRCDFIRFLFCFGLYGGSLVYPVPGEHHMQKHPNENWFFQFICLTSNLTRHKSVESRP